MKGPFSVTEALNELSPRVLTLTFSFEVPVGLKGNIRAKRLTDAVDLFTKAVCNLAPRAFPWAKSVTVQQDWSYRWRNGSSVMELPDTPENTSF